MFYVVHDILSLPGVTRVYKRGDVIRDPGHIEIFLRESANDATLHNKVTTTTTDPEA